MESVAAVSAQDPTSDRPVELSTTYEVTPKTVLQMYRACHRVFYVFRWVVTVSLLVVGLADRDLVFLLLAILFFAFGEWTIRRQLRPYLSGPHTVTVTITDDEYRTQGPGVTAARAWSTFTSVRRVGAFWVLRVTSMAAIALPVTALDDEQTAAFVELMRSKGLLRGMG